MPSHLSTEASWAKIQEIETWRVGVNQTIYPSTWVSHTGDDGKLLIENRKSIRLVVTVLVFFPFARTEYLTETT